MAHEHDSRLTRREALALLGAGAVASAAGARSVVTAARAAPSRVSSPSPRGALIRTILKDIAPAQAGNGAILFHEHLSFGPIFYEKMRPRNAPPPTAPRQPSYLEDVNLVTEELKASG